MNGRPIAARHSTSSETIPTMPEGVGSGTAKRCVEERSSRRTTLSRPSAPPGGPLLIREGASAPRPSGSTRPTFTSIATGARSAETQRHALAEGKCVEGPSPRSPGRAHSSTPSARYPSSGRRCTMTRRTLPFDAYRLAASAASAAAYMGASTAAAASSNVVESSSAGISVSRRSCIGAPVLPRW